MSLPRFFCEGRHETTLLNEEDSAHLLRVLRARPGDRLVLCGGDGFESVAALEGAENGRAIVRADAPWFPSPGEPAAALRLYPSVSRGERFEWMLQKSAELGAYSVTPVLSARCVAGLPDEKKLLRWRRILREAAMQSGRGRIPELAAPLGFADACAAAADGLKVFCYEEERGLSLRALLSAGPFQHVHIFTGPEGGYTPEEADIARTNGFACVSIGTRILRCETAPLAVLAAALYEAGEM